MKTEKTTHTPEKRVWPKQQVGEMSDGAPVWLENLFDMEKMRISALSGIDPEEYNRELYAAAPDLLEAARMAVSGKGDFLGALCAAIAKAEGREVR